MAFFNKWLHLLSIIGVMGGLVFAWLVLAPAARAEDEQTSEIMKTMWKRFGIAVGAFWIVALATGFYNLVLVTPSVNAGYQMYVGMKMGLAILMFLVTMLVAHPLPMMARFFRNRASWLLSLLLIGVVIVGLSAHLNLSRINGTGLKATVPGGQNQTTPPFVPHS